MIRAPALLLDEPEGQAIATSAAPTTARACGCAGASLYSHRERRPVGRAPLPDQGLRKGGHRPLAAEDLSLLTDDEKRALVALLKRTIDADRYPLFAANRPAAGYPREAGAAPTGAPAAAALCAATRQGKAAEGTRLAPDAAVDLRYRRRVG